MDAAKSSGPLPRMWRFFGADEPNYATMKDGRKLMKHLGELSPGSVYFRTHNLLSSGDGTSAFKWGSTNAYTEDKQGNPVYNWTIVDGIFDSYLARGVRPYLQIGFMPQALSSAPANVPYQHEWRPGFPYNMIGGGWGYPPKDYDKWGELVYQWTKHNVERYGREEVEKWYFEVWNEPDGPDYWKATPEEFFKLHDYAIAAVKRALPTARVGGADVASANNARYMEGFMEHVANGKNYATGETGTPTDFIAFHAKGSPQFVDGHVRMGISNHLQRINTGFRKVAASPAHKAKPIIIGESDPEGCAACAGPQMGYRNGLMYSSYTAASFARKWDLAERHGVKLEGVLTWAFTFEDQPWFAGFRQLASNGIDLPVLNIFRMYEKMGSERLDAASSSQVALDDIVAKGVRAGPDVGVLATRDAKKLAIMVWHYRDDDVPGPDAAIALDIAGLGRAFNGARVTHWRVDERHSNAFDHWKRMGSPAAPTFPQYQELEKASQLVAVGPEQSLATKGGKARLDFNLPLKGVSLIVIEAK
ncbi:MAG TPA: beta-xylosidase [Sphingomonas sp.]